MPVPPWVHEPETTPLGHFWYPHQEPANAEFYAAWPVSSRPGGEVWPKDDPAQKPVIAGNGIGKGQAFILGDTAFALNKNFDSSSPNAGFWRTLLKNWLGRSADTPQTVEPSESGLINLPKPTAGKGATP